MRQAGSFVGWDFEGVNGDGRRDTWFMRGDGYPELSWLEKKSIPAVTGLSAAEACKRIENAGFRVGRMTYDYDHAVEYGCAITTHPFLIARPGSDIGIVLSLGSYEWSANPGTGDANQPYLILTEGQLDCLAYRPDLSGSVFQTGRQHRYGGTNLYQCSDRTTKRLWKHVQWPL